MNFINRSKKHLAPTFSSARGFVELFAKTNYSFLEGASHPEEIVEKAHILGYPAIGITDLHGVYGIPRAHVDAKNRKIKLLIGAELSIEGGAHVSALVKNREGYGDLCELLTTLHSRDSLTITWEELNKISPHSFLFLPLQTAVKAPLELLRKAFGPRLFLIASRCFDGRDRPTVDFIHQFSLQHQLPCVASNQPLFHERQRKIVQDVQTCIRHSTTLEEAGFKLLPNTERHLKSLAEMDALFYGHPEWLETTLEIANEISFSMDEITYHYPMEWIPEGETGFSYLEKLTWAGAKRRYGDTLPHTVQRQLQHELALIQDLHYSDYFLTIWDIVEFAKSQNILCQGRGSAANSIVCYVLGITAIDPVRMELLFERFLSRERKEPPDIDIDFEHERREEVIQYIYRRYGRHRAAITATNICYRRRSTLREVAKVFSIPLPTVERFLTLTHRKNFDEIPFSDFASAAPDTAEKTLRQYLAIYKRLLGFPRHLGTHVGGFVLCHDPLTRNVPIEKAAMEDRTIVQWDKNDLDSLGFTRVDILGLGILTCIRKSFEILRSVYAQDFTLATIPAEDPKVYESIQAGDTIGVFQIESRAQMNMLPRLKPNNFFDLVVEISIVRPGPIQGEMVHPYLRRRAGKEPVEYAHPDLEAILKKTYGVPLFQEQIMKMAMAVAGFTPGEADELRRAMGTWRKQGELYKMGDRFREGLMKKGIKKEFADRIFSQIEGFAEYGFPESHAASFAILAYATAWLHTYYPDVYLTALLNSQPMGFYSPHTLIYDAFRHGVKVDGIDINLSRWDNRLEAPGKMRLGFRQLKGFSEATARAIEKSQPFDSLTDFVTRTQQTLHPRPLTKRELFLLASSHAFQRFGLSRREALWEIQGLHLIDSHNYGPESEQQTALPQEDKWETLSLDYESQRVSLTAHPMALLRNELNFKGVVSSKDLKTIASGRRVTVAGICICRQMPPTAGGVFFMTLEDEFGFTNLVIWNRVFEQFRDPLLNGSFFLGTGKIERAEETNVVHLIVETVAPLTLLEPKSTASLSHDFQ